MDESRIVTVSRFLPYAFFFVTSAEPATAIELLAAAANSEWEFASDGVRFTLHSPNRFASTFHGQFTASVAGANVRVVKRVALATRIVDVAILGLLLGSGALTVDYQQTLYVFPAALAFLAGIVLLLARVSLGMNELDRVKELLLSALPA